MGGRGGSSGRGGGPIVGKQERTIETTVFLPGSRTASYGRPVFKNEVLEATSDKDGNVTFSYARGKINDPSAKTNKTTTAEFRLKAGAVDGETFGIDWSKVRSISGQTYNLRQAAKAAGLKWDGARKMWVRRE